MEDNGHIGWRVFRISCLWQIVPTILNIIFLGAILGAGRQATNTHHNLLIGSLWLMYAIVPLAAGCMHKSLVVAIATLAVGLIPLLGLFLLFWALMFLGYGG